MSYWHGVEKRGGGAFKGIRRRSLGIGFEFPSEEVKTACASTLEWYSLFFRYHFCLIPRLPTCVCLSLQIPNYLLRLWRWAAVSLGRRRRGNMTPEV